jgi:hypothetical protein
MKAAQGAISTNTPTSTRPNTTNELMSEPQWQQVVQSPENEARFQNWRNSEDFVTTTNRLWKIKGSMQERGTVSEEETGWLIYYLAYHDWGTRVMALSLASKAKPKELRRLLTPHVAVCANDPNPLVRKSAVQVLGVIGDESVLPLLQQKLNDPEPTVQEAAGKAIEKLQQN